MSPESKATIGISDPGNASRALSNWVESEGALGSLFDRIFCGKPVSTFPENALVGLSVGCSIHQQYTKKKDQIEHRKHEQATSRPPFLVIAPTYLP